MARIVFEPLSQQLGQSIIVENRGGAGGTIGAGMVARADPDGYTLLAHSSAHTATPAIYPNAPYDAARDFVAVAALGSSPNIVVVAPEKGIKTLQELVAAAKQKAGAMTFGTAGVGSSTHFTTERFRFSAGFDGVHVPFRGMPEVLTEVMTGRVDFCFSTIASALPFIRDGKLVALAVSTPKRSSALPDVPTTLELGYANSDYTFWNGLFVPAKTPRDIVERLHQPRRRRPSTAPAVQEKLAQQGIDPMPIDARGVRRADQERDRGEHRAGEGGRHQDELSYRSDPTNQSAICAPVQNSTSLRAAISSIAWRKYFSRCGAPMM